MPAASPYAYVPHPHADEHRKQRPAQHGDQHPGFNGRLAAWMTRKVGSMWAVYVTTAFVLIWIALAEAGPLSADRYPFPFLLFLGNVVQLLLVFVILVGQQVLGATADRRARDTYEDAEAILHEVEQLRLHLIAQDRLLNQGIRLGGREPHPWIEERRSRKQPTVADMHVGLNGRIASFVTQKVGTMWAFYGAAIFQFGWIGLARAGMIRFDPYPFAFLLFLSSLSQLILMFVIMVGQDVLAREGDHRADETYRDVEAVLHECLRLQEHLTAQDETIVGIVEHLQQRPVLGAAARAGISDG